MKKYKWYVEWRNNIRKEKLIVAGIIVVISMFVLLMNI